MALKFCETFTDTLYSDQIIVKFEKRYWLVPLTIKHGWTRKFKYAKLKSDEVKLVKISLSCDHYKWLGIPMEKHP